MSDQYHKITTVWERDPDNNYKTLIEGRWATPEFAYLRDAEWLFTEKVDGTNIRVFWRPGNDVPVTFGGKTDRAQIPAHLLEALQATFPPEKLEAAFDGPACLYGEGYGPKIQKGGGKYRTEPGFILFDVRVGDWWLRWEDVEDVARELGILIVPVVGHGSLAEGIEIVRDGLESRVAVEPRQAEGLVMRPTVDLFARNGSRIITKVKGKDFR